MQNSADFLIPSPCIYGAGSHAKFSFWLGN